MMEVELKDHSQQTNYYSFMSDSEMKCNRLWLCYSQKLDRVYCQPCWLFPQHSEKTFGSTGLNDWKHLSDRIKTHKQSDDHILSCVIFENGGMMKQ